MPQVKAVWVVALNAECPRCFAVVDLLENDTDKEALPEVGENASNLGIEVCCPNCEEEFILNETEY